MLLQIRQNGCTGTLLLIDAESIVGVWKLTPMTLAAWREPGGLSKWDRNEGGVGKDGQPLRCEHFGTLVAEKEQDGFVNIADRKKYFEHYSPTRFKTRDDLFEHVLSSTSFSLAFLSDLARQGIIKCDHAKLRQTIAEFSAQLVSSHWQGP